MIPFTLDQIRALWRAFVTIGTVGTTMSIVGTEETPFNQALDNDPEWQPLKITFGKNRKDRDLEPFFLPSMFTPKPKTVARDPEARAQRVVDTLLQDPKLAVLVRKKLGTLRVAKPWSQDHRSLGREVLGHMYYATYMKPDGMAWRLMIVNKGKHICIDTTDDMEAGKAALDLYLINTGWILL